MQMSCGEKHSERGLSFGKGRVAGARWAEMGSREHGTSHMLHTKLIAFHKDVEHRFLTSIVYLARDCFFPRAPRHYSLKELGTLKKFYYCTNLVTSSQQILRTKSRQAIIALQSPQSGSSSCTLEPDGIS